MRGFASITLALRISIAIIIFIGVWLSLNSYTDSMKDVEMTNNMQIVAEHVEAKILYCLKTMQSPESTYIKEKVYLPDFREYYSISIGCSADLLTINATVPTRGINFIIKDYINCSNMEISGSFLPAGERCVFANRTGGGIRITLVNNCASV